MKAIQTFYKGYKFRSRLEARWAVFFDALDIEWQYETEGFELGKGLYYLPDFYLPDLLGKKAWIEVKPDIPYPDDIDVKKVVEFQKEIYPNAIIFIAAKDPYEMKSCIVAIKENPDGSIGINFGFFGALPNNELVLILTSTDDYALLIQKGSTTKISNTEFLPFIEAPFIEKARIAARSARFEHGQSGAG